MDHYDRLVRGICRFQTQVFPGYRTLFQHLSKGQTPATLFITCSDSRIDPSLIMQVEPGELFLIRNPGNIVPGHGIEKSGEAAAIEYALTALNVKDIIVCGHSDCGAVKGLLAPSSLKQLPSMKRWLSYTRGLGGKVRDSGTHLGDEIWLNEAIQQNVVAQLANLQTMPTVKKRLAQGKLRLHGWMYVIETAAVLAYEHCTNEFLPVVHTAIPASFQHSQPLPPPLTESIRNDDEQLRRNTVTTAK